MRHPGGAKDSRHSDGATYLGSSGLTRDLELRVPLSQVTNERINVVQLPSSMDEPRPLGGPARVTDLVVDVASVGTIPSIAVEVVANSELDAVRSRWQAVIGVSSVLTVRDKGLSQSLLLAVMPEAPKSIAG